MFGDLKERGGAAPQTGLARARSLTVCSAAPPPGRVVVQRRWDSVQFRSQETGFAVGFSPGRWRREGEGGRVSYQFLPDSVPISFLRHRLEFFLIFHRKSEGKWNIFLDFRYSRPLGLIRNGATNVLRVVYFLYYIV